MGRFIYVLGLISLVILPAKANAWGFWAHQRINRLAVFTLPPEMFGLYKEQLEYLTEHAVDPDMRRYAVDGEAAHHYIDIDHFGSYPFPNVPRSWEKAVEKFTADTLEAYGVLPYHLPTVVYRLRDAFVEGDLSRIMKLSADLGHYVGDAHVPLHTTHNYNGQFTGQKGIHGFWESRLPELFASDYDLFVGRAFLIEDLLGAGWETVLASHLAKDSVLLFEAKLNDDFPSDKKYGYESRNQIVIRTYSRDYSQAYHQALDGMVERRMRKAIRTIGSYWYTAWVMAGSPDLSKLQGRSLNPPKMPFERLFKIIDRESDAIGYNPLLTPIHNHKHLCCSRPKTNTNAMSSPIIRHPQSTIKKPIYTSIWYWLKDLVND